jgi:hypothetical protein
MILLAFVGLWAAAVALPREADAVAIKDDKIEAALPKR